MSMLAQSAALAAHHADSEAIAGLRPHISQRTLVWRRFRRHKLAMLGAGLFAILVLASLAAPLLVRYPPDAQDLFNILQAPNATHWLGTDELGRDVFSRLLYGGRTSLLIGIASTLVALVVGVSLGAISGWLGGWVDAVLMRFVDAMLSFPALFLLLIIFSMVGATVGTIILFLGLFGWMYLARIVRGEFLALKEREFVAAARVIGASDARIVLRHLIPACAAAIIVTATLEVAYNMLYEAFLDFLGLGVPPETPTWGNMLTNSETYILSSPYLVIVPGLILTVAILAINFLGDGIRDALDPLQG
jgi:peptide/nickel transport system permease protein